MKIYQAWNAGAKTLKANFLPRVMTPISVYISVTDRCPHTCEYCNIPNRKIKEMSAKEIFSLIGQVRKAGAVRLQIAGGEPLIRKDIGEIIDCAKDHGLYVTAASTGFFPEKTEAIKNIDLIFLSFDGEESVHDYHKGKGTYKKLMETMQRLKDSGVKFWTTTVLTKVNKDSIGFILQSAYRNNFRTVFQPLYYTLISYKDHFHLPKVADKFVLSNEEIRLIFKKLIAAKNEGAPIASSLPYLEYMSNWPDYRRIYSSDRDRRVKCWAGKLYCYIDTNGLVYPCGDSIGVVEGIDCLKNSFAKAFRKINFNRGCQACIIACDLEKNLMFSLSIKTIMNWIRYVYKKN